METTKIHIYFVPGLAASSKIFEYLRLPEAKFELHFIEWLMPLSENEPLEAYAKRMAALVLENNPVLVGVSFGGIMVQEMSKHLKPQKTIIISSIKSNKELAISLKIIKQTKAYKLFPAKAISTIEDFSMLAFGEFVKKRMALYQKYLSVRDKTYLTWAIANVLNWKQTEPLKDCIHIHGTNDHIFPIKYIDNCIEVKNGTHIMIINKAKTIGKILSDLF
ncbi:alpha/beta hydrolase [Lutibacter sp. HS1-25]|uniref:alpha/beta hydrolase n=1 Tax=Lutibacter sp. HS1-25 TaxID=2485000 RepID=UPI001010A0AA|nr:alpha/beta hydrolase [Lutibacter sp. HS1-25]RXP53223.1 alpha/beta hydrolase [Lutibacter sp. HS1-25]